MMIDQATSQQNSFAQLFKIRTLALTLLFLITGCSEEENTQSQAQHHIHLAQSYLSQGQFQASIIEAKNALQKDPTDLKAMETLGDIFQTMSSHKQAQQHYDNVLKKKPNDTTVFLKWAESMLLSNHIDDVEQALDQQPSTFKTSEAAKLLQAKITQGKQNNETALRLYQAILDQHPENSQAWLGKAEIAFSQKKLREADKYLMTAAEHDSENINIMLLQARIDTLKENWPDAEQHYSDILLQVGHYDVITAHKYIALEGIVNALIAQGKSEDAIRFSKTLNETPQKRIISQYAEAINRYKSGEATEAVAQLEELLALTPNNPTITAALGMIKLTQGDYENAEILLESSAGTDYVAENSAKLLAITYLKSGKSEQAITHLKEILEKQPDDLDVQAMLATAHVQSGKYEDAESLLTKTLTKDPNHRQALNALAFIQIKGKHYQQAKDNYLKIALENPNDVRALQGIIQVEHLLKTDSPSALQEVIKKHPKVLQPRVSHIAALILKNQFQQAISNAQKVYQQFPKEEKTTKALTAAYFAQTQVYASQKNWSQAMDTLKQALSYDENNLKMLVYKSKLAYKIGGEQASEQAISNIIKAHPNSGVGQTLLGDLKLQGKHLPEAITAYKAAWDLSKNHTLGLRLFNAQLEHGTKSHASLKHLETWVETEPENANAKLALALAYQRVGIKGSAIHMYEQLVEQKIKSALVYNNLAWLYFEKSDNKALDTAEKAYKLAPEDPNILDTYGWILFKNGYHEEAIPHLKKALEKAPNHPEIKKHYEQASKTQKTALTQQ